MPEDIKPVTGCQITPPPPGMAPFSSVEFLGASNDVAGVPEPDQFIVPYYRDLFDADFKRVKTAVAGKPIKNQRGIPSCVGESTAYQKAADEGEEMSGRDGYRLAKRKEDPIDLLSWGTGIWQALDAQVDTGIATSKMVPDISDRPLAEYVSVADVTPEVVADRAKHKTARAYFVERTEISATLWKTQRPVVTSSRWYSADNQMPNATMVGPSGNDVGGHAFCVIGVVRRGGLRCLAVLNSWTEFWGDGGCFYIPLNGPGFLRLGNGYLSVDVAANVADILARYNGKIVKTAGDPAVWKIEAGRKRHIPDERVFWAMGLLFGEEQDISASDLGLIERGVDVGIGETDPRMQERVRQIGQFYGH